MYSQFSRSNTARGSSTCPVTVGPTKVRLVSLFCSLKITPLIKKEHDFFGRDYNFIVLGILLYQALNFIVLDILLYQAFNFKNYNLSITVLLTLISVKPKQLRFTVLLFGQVTKVFGLLYSVILQSLIWSSFSVILTSLQKNLKVEKTYFFSFEQCSVIERNIATFDFPFDFNADARRNLKLLRESIADEFLARYNLRQLPRSDRILPHVQVHFKHLILG